MIFQKDYFCLGSKYNAPKKKMFLVKIDYRKLLSHKAKTIQIKYECVCSFLQTAIRPKQYSFISYAI